MISAFKHIRLSGHNFIPIKDVSYNGSDVLRLSLGNTGVAYYHELTGISGHLQGLIDIANDDVTRINDLHGSVKITGSAGIGIGIDPITNTITISGADSGYFQGLIDGLSNDIESTGTTLVTTIEQTGTSLANRLASTGEHVYSYYVRKATQQSFTLSVPTNIESTGITFPVAFSSTPSSVNVTLEVPGDVMYMTAIKNKSNTGFTAEFSDIILEEGVKLNTFASNPTNT